MKLHWPRSITNRAIRAYDHQKQAEQQRVLQKPSLELQEERKDLASLLFQCGVTRIRRPFPHFIERDAVPVTDIPNDCINLGPPRVAYVKDGITFTTKGGPGARYLVATILCPACQKHSFAIFNIADVGKCLVSHLPCQHFAGADAARYAAANNLTAWPDEPRDVNYGLLESIHRMDIDRQALKVEQARKQSEVAILCSKSWLR